MAQELSTGPQRVQEYQSPGFDNPSPEEVERVYKEVGSIHNWAGVRVVKLSAEVAVKFGAPVHIHEADQMRFVAEHTQKLLLPKVFGCYRYGPYARDPDDYGSVYDTYIFMSYVEGETLEKAWPSYDAATKATVSSQLRTYMDELRSIPSESYIGSANRGKVTDSTFDRASRKGPFDSEEDFNAAFIDVYQKNMPKQHIRSFLEGMLSERKHRIVFTHGDFRPGNIMVKDGIVSGIVDWQYAGWYPEYWEFAKSLFIWKWQNDWTDYLQKVLDPYYAESHSFLFMAHDIW